MSILALVLVHEKEIILFMEITLVVQYKQVSLSQNFTDDRLFVADYSVKGV